MQPLHFRAASLASAALLLVAGLATSGCSSASSSSKPSHTGTSGPATSPSSPAPSTSSGGPTSGTAAVAAIEANWAKFFNAKTPISQRLALLENGSQFSSVISSQEGSPLALAASSKVTHVTLTGTNQASVSYEILLNGKPALTGQSGVAVYQDGVWKVGDTSFCGLLKLEGSKLPAGCKG